ncbi:MAG: [Fe-Fe] hydrogenase large subunit C-terminal domain-containing protein [Intestinibacter bartlettii]|uniref:[Fe-Fe] hydrogenase large subunit C-terminal domain-containing protein n=1 Tax=Intestinibacter bartlettii TaxID=261299 RepID=UPI0026EF8468|nr:[Fe-Fe] hydrogenase large subunit C-terminal domain-containing protein [Intestinibacter bartlettii]MDO5010285.1 [Fe-Fe] hydrogenase large subunit C-terminal domain-containing protein [Intestinibacter bartlettii]
MSNSKFARKGCRECYACVRVCPADAIVIKGGQADILADRCIFCGRCSKACPQHYRVEKMSISAVKEFIQSGENVIASVAPSFASAFGNQSLKIPAVLRKLGFSHVEDSGITTKPIFDIYNTYADKDDNNNYITSMCPTIDHLIQKHYPELTESIIPVVPPFISHGRFLKHKYGAESKVVFIGPCVAKKTDATKEICVDEVLTFYELQKWIKSENLNLDDFPIEPFDYVCNDKILFPIPGETADFLEKKNPKKTVFCVDGIEDCKSVLNSIRNGKFENTFFEMNACSHGCLYGSDLDKDDRCFFEVKRDLINNKQKYIDLFQANAVDNPYQDIALDVLLYKEYPPKPFHLEQPTEYEIREILKTMGKTVRSDELNCGSCGYHTCREKAVAVFNGLAEPSMCLPYMRNRAESLSNLICESSPNLIGLVDKDLMILELNPAAESFFKIQKDEANGMPLGMYLDDEEFERVRTFRKNVRNEKITFEEYDDSTLLQTIYWLEQNQMFLWLAVDITKDERAAKKLQTLKMETVEMAQQVIAKQMTVAQEIASLLGETTAETKVTLTKLKNFILDEEGDE